MNFSLMYAKWSTERFGWVVDDLSRNWIVENSKMVLKGDFDNVHKKFVKI